MKQKKLSRVQAEALREIKEHGGLKRGAIGTVGYWQWCFADTGHWTIFPSVTVDALRRRGLVRVDPLPDGSWRAMAIASSVDNALEPHFDGIGFRHRIALRHLDSETGRPFSAKEDIAAQAEETNGWLTPDQVEACRTFQGTEGEAIALRRGIEREISKSNELASRFL